MPTVSSSPGFLPRWLTVPTRLRTALICLLIAAVTLPLYIWRLHDSPVSLGSDEVTIALNAESIASTGHDMNGRFLPLYVQVTKVSWFQPLIIYSVALVLKVLPLSEAAIRLPTALVGVLNVVLIFLVARKIVRHDGLAVCASLMLAFTPAHFLHSRFAMDFIYPLPFVLGWLLGLLTYLDTRRVRPLLLGTLCLGLGFYSYIAAVLFMPLYLMLTALTLLNLRAPLRDYAAAAGGFVLPIAVLFVPWLLLHPGAYADTVSRYALYDTKELNALQGLRSFFSYTNIAARLALYWNYLSPSYLFFDATAPAMFTTRLTGVFLTAEAIFVIAGIYRALLGARQPENLLLLLGFLTAPLGAMLVAEQGSINRALEILPFGVLLATVGLSHLWFAARFPHRRAMGVSAATVGLAVAIGYMGWTLLQESRVSASSVPLLFASVLVGVLALVSDRTAWRAIAVALIIASVWQFRIYAVDYFGSYRERSSLAFGGNLPSAFAYIVERTPVPAVYIADDIGDAFWMLYAKIHRKDELIPATVYFGPATVRMAVRGGSRAVETLDPAAMPEGSLVLSRIRNPITERLADQGSLKHLTIIYENNGSPSYTIFSR